MIYTLYYTTKISRRHTNRFKDCSLLPEGLLLTSNHLTNVGIDFTLQQDTFNHVQITPQCTFTLKLNTLNPLQKVYHVIFKLY